MGRKNNGLKNQSSPSPSSSFSSSSSSVASLRSTTSALVDTRLSLIKERDRASRLSTSFLIKAKLALANQDEGLASEVLSLMGQQRASSDDVLLYLKEEERQIKDVSTKLDRLSGVTFNQSIGDELESQRRHQPSVVLTRLNPQYKIPPIVPSTASLHLQSPHPSSTAPLISQWLLSFSREKDSFSSYGLYAELKLREAICHAEESQGPDKSDPRLDGSLPAVCCDLLLKLGRSDSGFRFAPLLRLLGQQLLKCIYCMGDESEDDGDLLNGDNNARWLYAKKTWHDKYRTAEEQRVGLQEVVDEHEEGRILKEKVEKSKGGVGLLLNKEKMKTRNMIFRIWKEHFLRERGTWRKWKRTRLARWMRLWRISVFGEGAVDGTTADDRDWKKKFEQAAEEKKSLELRIKELEDNLQHAKHELEDSYEIIAGLSPEIHDQHHDKAEHHHLTLNMTHKIATMKNKVRQGGQGPKAAMVEAMTQTEITGPITLGGADEPFVKIKVRRDAKQGGKKTITLQEVLMSAGPGNAELDSGPKMSQTLGISLIAEILYSLLVQIDTDKKNAREHLSFPEFCRDCMIRRFGIKALAMKNLRGLCVLAKNSVGTDILFSTFSSLIGILPGDASTPEERYDLMSHVARFLAAVAGPTPFYKVVTQSLGSADGGRHYDRAKVVEAFTAVFPNLREHKKDAYKKLMADVIALKTVIIAEKVKEPKVMLDEALALAIRYAPAESAARPLRGAAGKQAAGGKGGELTATTRQALQRVVRRFMFNACAFRVTQMVRTQRLFKEWDSMLHAAKERSSSTTGLNNGGEVVALAGAVGIVSVGGYHGSFSLREFEDMLRAGLKVKISDHDCLLLFNDWHELMEEDKRNLGFVGGDDDDVSKEPAGASIELAEKEMLETEAELERKKVSKRKEDVAVAMRRNSIAAIKGEKIADAPERESKPLPARAAATKKWKVAYLKVRTGFFFRDFGPQDEHEARLLEGRMGGSKFGMAAFSQLLWKHRLFVQ